MQVLVTRTLRDDPAVWEVFLDGRTPVEVSALADCQDVLAVTFGSYDEQHETGETAQQGQRPAPEDEGVLGEESGDVRGERDDELPAEQLPGPGPGSPEAPEGDSGGTPVGRDNGDQNGR